MLAQGWDNAFEGLDYLCDDRPPVPALSDRSNSLFSGQVSLSGLHDSDAALVNGTKPGLCCCCGLA